METTKQNDVNVDARIPETPMGIARSRDAFLRDLPELLANPKYDRWCVVYHGDEQICIAESEAEVVRERIRRGIREDQCYIGCICPHSEDEVEEIEGGLTFVEYDDETGNFKGPTTE